MLALVWIRIQEFVFTLFNVVEPNVEWDDLFPVQVV